MSAEMDQTNKDTKKYPPQLVPWRGQPLTVLGSCSTGFITDHKRAQGSHGERDQATIRVGILVGVTGARLVPEISLRENHAKDQGAGREEVSTKEEWIEASNVGCAS